MSASGVQGVIYEYRYARCQQQATAEDGLCNDCRGENWYTSRWEPNYRIETVEDVDA